MRNTQGDYVEGAINATETTETVIGTITLPSGGKKRIVGIYGLFSALTTTAEIASGYFRLRFKSVPGVFKFPASVFQGPAGTLASPGFQYDPKIIPVNIDCEANESVDCSAGQFVASTSTTRAQIGIIWEDAS